MLSAHGQKVLKVCRRWGPGLLPLYMGVDSKNSQTTPATTSTTPNTPITGRR